MPLVATAPDQLALLVQCHDESVWGGNIHLERNIKIEPGGPPKAVNGDGDNEIDFNAPVYPIRGASTNYCASI